MRNPRNRYKERDKIVASLPPIPKQAKPLIFTPEILDDIFALQKQGYYIRQIAEAYSVCKSHMVSIMFRAKNGSYQKLTAVQKSKQSRSLPPLGDLKVPDIYNPSVVAEIVRLTKEGYAPSELGKAYGIQKDVIGRIARYAQMEGKIITRTLNGVKRNLICRGGKAQIFDKLSTAPKKHATCPKPFVKKQSAKGPTPRPVDVETRKTEVQYINRQYILEPGYRAVPHPTLKNAVTIKKIAI